MIELFDYVLTQLNDEFCRGEFDLDKVKSKTFECCFKSELDFGLFDFFFDALHLKRRIPNSYFVNKIIIIIISAIICL